MAAEIRNLVASVAESHKQLETLKKSVRQQDRKADAQTNILVREIQRYNDQNTTIERQGQKLEHYARETRMLMENRKRSS